MKHLKPSKQLLVLALSAFFMLYMTACNDNSVEDVQTDDQFITEVVTNGYSSSSDDDDNLMRSEITDFDDGGAAADQVRRKRKRRNHRRVRDGQGWAME